MSKLKLSPEQFEKYIKDPLSFDKELRKLLDVPEDRYYSVSVMNEVGVVTLNSKTKK